MFYSYGDLSPVTPLGRALAVICAIFGISVVSMLVSVLAERYQRVYTRKLFLNEKYSDNIVFEDDENNETSSISNDNQMIESQIRSHSVPNLDENIIFKGILKENELEEKPIFENSREKIHFIIGTVSNGINNNKETMMIDAIKEIFQSKFGKQCLITRTDVFVS